MAKNNNDMSEGIKTLFAKKAAGASHQEVQQPGKTPKRQREKANPEPPVRTPLGANSSGGLLRTVKEAAWAKERTLYTSSAFDREQYEELRKLSFKENVPLKEILYQFIKIGLEAYKNGKFDFQYFRDYFK